MPSCGCVGQTCGCLIGAGSGVEISGTGSQANPFIINVVGSDMGGLLQVTDTPSVNMSLGGTGSTADPYRVSAVATLAMTELRDVIDAAGPAVGEVPVWVAASGPTPAHFEFRPPPTAPAGAVNAGAGLSGDGSVGAPLTVRTSGVWGTAPLNVFGANSLLGNPTYVDSAGQIRVQPFGADLIANAAAPKPSAYRGRIYIQQDSGAAFWSDGTNWSSMGTSVTWATLSGKPSTFPPSAHNHNDLYYLKAEIDARIPPVGTRFATATNTGWSARAVQQVLSTNSLGLWWNGSLPVLRVDNTDFPLTTQALLSAVQLNLQGQIDARAVGYGDNNTVRYAVGPTANGYNRTVTSAYFATYMDGGLEFGRNVSARRYKHDITDPDADGLTLEVLTDGVKGLRGRTFKRNADPNGPRNLGFVAEEVEEVAPWLVLYDKGEIESVAYETTLPATTAIVVGDLIRRIEALEAAAAPPVAQKG